MQAYIMICLAFADGAEFSEFVLGADGSCSTDLGSESHCNGPLMPNTSYAVQLVFINDAGFVSSRPFTFRTSETWSGLAASVNIRKGGRTQVHCATARWRPKPRPNVKCAAAFSII